MTVTSEVIETKLEDEFFIGEDEPTEGEELSPLSDEDAAFRKFEGKAVANGSYTVPRGVAVEELKNYAGHKDLKNKCPEDVRLMLESKDLFDAYDRFVQSIVDTKTTRGSLGKWRDQQFISVLDEFRDDFTDKCVKVVLCKRKSANGTYRWLEFIDVEEVGGSYVPQYDVSNYSGQIIKTYYTKLKFPNGVAVEELKQWGGRGKLKEKVPIYVERMLEKHDLLSEYEQMVDHVVEAGVGRKLKNWNIKKLKELIAVYQPMFADKGVDIYISHKQEYVSHGQHGGHTEYFRWIEFVDRELQPSYQPQRDAENKRESCTVM
mmetsp:Transcript_21536/g.52032  ORF Transcript_21536/g.52032 Transcript_21536/m.52032 type:complete len:319 (-) Transcript_21536:227-1183(-)|eukprot:CAMPEP_0181107272 /NCGR_PEP_ID=MMETSP1071-20121207/16994_1 /TAXON_ID=35127 /ORGANISM="Thalassiosira sp., Strain NH16" /LENGTH=318 /DNA_ID=CAMNT_0023190769 /DNA_START=182 /DNA_END=1138 /DNA_ORIENTATION=+